MRNCAPSLKRPVRVYLKLTQEPYSERPQIRIKFLVCGHTATELLDPSRQIVVVFENVGWVRGRSAAGVRAGQYAGPERPTPARRPNPGPGVHRPGLGKNTQRPKLEELIRFARAGGVAHSMDRLARNMDDLQAVVQSLTGKGCGSSS